MHSSPSHDLQPIAPAMNTLPPSTQHPSLPSSSSASENNTPIPSGSADPKKKPSAKRKRTGDTASDSPDGSGTHPRTRDGPKKKKANRACFHCQKAHLTCDDSRPCQRCIKRGMADNCTEGHRKKAKYLLDDEELEALKRAKSGEGSAKGVEGTQPQRLSQPPPPPPEQAVPPTQYISPEAMFPAYQAPGSFGIPAEAANLEYSILSAILGGSPDSGSGGSPATAHATQAGPSTSYAPTQSSGLASAAWPASEPVPGQYAAPGQPAGAQGYAGAGVGGAGAQGYGEQQPPLAIQPSDTTLSAAPEYIAPAATTGYAPAGAGYAAQTGQGQGGGAQPYVEYVADQSQAQAQGAGAGAVGAPAGGAAGAGNVYGAGSPPSSFLSRPRRNPSSPLASRMVPSWATGTSGLSLSTPNGAEGAVQSVYKSVTKGYDYTQGYHFLMKHISRRFEKNDILRIVRALAIVRPSFIALQMPMSEEDEVFVEKCFQRSLIELDKLVSFSGTPTVAWRRTGEICLVGPEFCMLTGWEKEELVGRRKYIYELFENQSVVEYWENFANHAFENTTQSVYSHCVLLKPSGAPVPCTFCFSIRRDIMDLPSLVIGQWLPLL
ncbi:hypothetical protein PYCCODRAFT_1442371 [Trametes coccinea BRFM310]|uniref:Transcription activator of gluconeogenesis ERT1 n=1 Tax=Trametes coccinea (strain BRFM310) TaxID=1353009 RepID=A0A1Y2J0B3_TRAC3|nr:hypothetical protein PYCCODRAFT_1442371 [Trametes coccinea BRFM310]